jgi:hypothetical protein
MQLKYLLLGSACALLWSQSAVAQTPDWRRPDTDGKYYWVLVDAKSIDRDTGTGRIRFTYAHAGGPNYRSLTPLGTSRIQAAFDCGTGQAYTLRDNQWKAESKGHLEGPIRAFVCKR